MRQTSKSTSCPDAWIVGGAAALFFGAFMGPFGLLIGAAMKHSIQKQQEEEMDAIAEAKANAVARNWAATRKSGESTLTHSTTVPSNFLIFGLPVTRTYTFTKEED